MAGPCTAHAEDKWLEAAKARTMPPAPIRERSGEGIVASIHSDQEVPNFSSLIAEKSLTSPPTRLVA